MSSEGEKTPAAPHSRRRHLRRLREMNARRIAELDLPCPCDLPTLCRQLGEQRNRPITLVPMPIPAPHPCGMWAAVQDQDLIFFDSNTTSAHQEHIILHELGHIICRHRGGDLLGDESVKRLFPNLDPEVVRGMLARAGYDDVDEQEAEIIAYLLRERMGGSAGRPAPERPEGEDALSRVERTLTLPSGSDGLVRQHSRTTSKVPRERSCRNRLRPGGSGDGAASRWAGRRRPGHQQVATAGRARN
jgi:hypothetical protein